MKDEWLQRVTAWRNSGLSIARWCREHEIDYKRFLYWRNRLGMQSAPSFRELVDRDTVTVDLKSMTAIVPVALLASLLRELAKC